MNEPSADRQPRASVATARSSSMAAIAEDLQFLLEQGEIEEVIARRLGFRSTASMRRRLRRAQRDDLIDELQARRVARR